MKTKHIIVAALAALSCGAASAQSALDAFTLSPVQLNGTARFVGMGGAFTSLGGDLSTITQNPAGLGSFRSNDLSITGDFDLVAKFNTTSQNGTYKYSDGRANLGSIGYVGVTEFNGLLNSLQWGISFNRLGGFNRHIKGGVPFGAMKSSLTNYIASFTDGYDPNALTETSSNNPYNYGDMDWLSALAFNTYMVNVDGTPGKYTGLMGKDTRSDAQFSMDESGSVDEVNFALAGNLSDMVYLGADLGITSVNFDRYSYYSESLDNAIVYSKEVGDLGYGRAEYNLNNEQHVYGSGVNLKVGVIVRPTDELRLGFAVHTPTWYDLDFWGVGRADGMYTDVDNVTYTKQSRTPEYSYKAQLNTPWRMMAGASYVFGRSAILSVDYERVAYNDMKLKSQTSDYDSYNTYYEDNVTANENIASMYKAANIVRAGLEVRVLPWLALRGGVNWQSAATTAKATSQTANVSTVGTQPAYLMDNQTVNFSLGAGARYQNFYLDMTYVHRNQTGTYHAYTNYDGNVAPTASYTVGTNGLVTTLGMRF